MIRFFSPRLLEGDGGNGGGNPNPAPAGGNDPMAAFARLLDRSGNDGAALARQLFEENYRHREQIRELQGKVPAQGAAVLTPEQAAAWAAYQQLGAPDQVQATIAAHGTLQRDLELRGVADASGYKFGVLKQLAGDTAFEVRDETKDGQATKAVYVKQDGKDIPLEQYASERWADFLPALRPAAAAGQQQAPNTGATNPAASRQAPAQQIDPKNPPRLSGIAWKE